MHRHFATLLMVLIILTVTKVTWADSWTATGPHIEVRLLSENDSLKQGTTKYLAVQMIPDPQWHTYWRNPGDSGEAPAITWNSSHQLVFGDINWPLPEAIPVAHLTNYGYSGAHLLMVPVDVPTDIPTSEEVTISADLSWLVCKEDCIPGWATLTTRLTVNEKPTLSEYAPLFAQTRSAHPETQWLSGQMEVNEESLALRFKTPVSAMNSSWQAFPFRSDIANHAADQAQANDNGFTNLVIAKSAYFPKTLGDANFLVTNGDKGYYLSASLSAVGEQTQRNSDSVSFTNVMIFVAMAFLGGIILNIMPCVLPILSIKALALQNDQQSGMHNFAYLMGVLTCFNAFAAIIIGLQSTGQQLGWGFHMQSSLVIVLLAFLFTFIALVLLDVFTVGSKMAGIGENLVTGDSPRSHFFTGLLAVVVASPCTAPFMAAALGVAMVSNPVTTLLIFNALAVGFALPLTLVFMSSRIRQHLPKPGQWMQTFKHFLAFPIFATVAWLCWVYAGQEGAFAQFILLTSLIAFSLFAWLLGSSKTSLSRLWILAMIASALSPALITAPNTDEDAAAQNITAYDPTRLNQLKQEQQVVLVNMTADWCITCKVNEQVAIKTDTVQQALAAENVHYLVGDWTNKNDQILNYLKQYERAGVPLYVVYAGNKSKTILPQILTPGLVVNALNEAQQELINVN